ncbi:MAG TPA: hypothetical protein VIL74_20495 [Pyrinomonadaceae bacterium]|jgi:hypothetical protein
MKALMAIFFQIFFQDFGRLVFSSKGERLPVPRIAGLKRFYPERKKEKPGNATKDAITGLRRTRRRRTARIHFSNNAP